MGGGRVPILCDGVNLRCFHLISASSVHTRSVLLITPPRVTARLPLRPHNVRRQLHPQRRRDRRDAAAAPVRLARPVSLHRRTVRALPTRDTRHPCSSPPPCRCPRQAPRLHPPPIGAHARGQRHRAEGLRISDGAAPDRRAALARFLGVALGCARGHDLHVHLERVIILIPPPSHQASPARSSPSLSPPRFALR